MQVERFSLGRYQKRFNYRIGAFKKRVMTKLFQMIVEDTPVDTGALKANWQFGKRVPTAIIQGNNDPASGIAAKVVANVDEKDGSYYIVNNLPYAHRIEYEGWSHTKAPQGMVRINMVKVLQMVRSRQLT